MKGGQICFDVFPAAIIVNWPALVECSNVFVSFFSRTSQYMCVVWDSYLVR